jgi:hypothetical protein
MDFKFYDTAATLNIKLQCSNTVVSEKIGPFT